MGSKADVDKAVAAAKAAFPIYSNWSVADRIALLERIIDLYIKRYDEVAMAISLEMGAPITLAKDSQAAVVLAILKVPLRLLKLFSLNVKKTTLFYAMNPLVFAA